MNERRRAKLIVVTPQASGRTTTWTMTCEDCGPLAGGASTKKNGVAAASEHNRIHGNTMVVAARK